MLKPSKLVKIIIGFSAFFVLLSCGPKLGTTLDSATDLTRGDIIKALRKDRKKEESKKAEKGEDETPIPTISKLIVSPPPPAIGGDKIISFSVTDQVPLKDVLIELGRVAKIDVDLDSGISGGVIINAKNRPLKEVIDRIATLGQLRYSYENGVLHFERDSPYIKNYFVDYLTEGTLWADVETNINAVLTGSENPNAEGESSGSSSSFTSNKSAGIISLFATDRQHKAVASYLADVEKHASAQVLIEAKIVEVKLNDSFQTGIDWSWTDTNSKGVVTNIATGAATANAAATGLSADTGLGSVKRTLFGGSLDVAVTALETFGTTKTISSPRIHAMNNQKATLNFADKLVYFKIESTQTQSTGDSDNVVETETATKQEENVGVELTIAPSINLRTREITMSITPKLSNKSGEVTDPTNSANVVPIIQSRELNTLAKIQSGNIVVIGGLMKEEASNTDSGIPYVGRLPVLGWLFKSVAKTSGVTETVIFVKATIVNSATPTSKIDRDLQEKFDPNRRRYFD